MKKRKNINKFEQKILIIPYGKFKSFAALLFITCMKRGLMKNVFYELYPCGHYFVQYGIFKFPSLCFLCILSVICFEFDAISKDMLTFV